MAARTIHKFFARSPNNQMAQVQDDCIKLHDKVLPPNKEASPELSSPPLFHSRVLRPKGLVLEQFRKHGITCEVSERVKSDIYRELLPLLNSGRIESLDNQRLIAQLCGLERRTARGGKDSIDYAPGAHDDVANSAAGALIAVSKMRGRIVITDEMLRRAAMPTKYTWRHRSPRRRGRLSRQPNVSVFF